MTSPAGGVATSLPGCSAQVEPHLGREEPRPYRAPGAPGPAQRSGSARPRPLSAAARAAAPPAPRPWRGIARGASPRAGCEQDAPGAGLQVERGDSGGGHGAAWASPGQRGAPRAGRAAGPLLRPAGSRGALGAAAGRRRRPGRGKRAADREEEEEPRRPPPAAGSRRRMYGSAGGPAGTP